MADTTVERILARYKTQAKQGTQDIAIGTLEKSVRILAKNLEKLGLKCEINVHRSGRGGFEYARSYVELDVSATWKDAEGEEDDAWADVKFLAGGYGEIGTGRDIGGSEGWKPMAAAGLKRIFEQLEHQGWKKPEAGHKAIPHKATYVCSKCGEKLVYDGPLPEYRLNHRREGGNCDGELKLLPQGHG